jgi:hypothetical protein
MLPGPAELYDAARHVHIETVVEFCDNDMTKEDRRTMIRERLEHAATCREMSREKTTAVTDEDVFDGDD